jgi:hypothetical protein
VPARQPQRAGGDEGEDRQPGQRPALQLQSTPAMAPLVAGTRRRSGAGALPVLPLVAAAAASPPPPQADRKAAEPRPARF